MTTMMGEIAQASMEQRREIMTLNEIPLDKVREAFIQIEQKYRDIYRSITDKYIKTVPAD